MAATTGRSLPPDAETTGPKVSFRPCSIFSDYAPVVHQTSQVTVLIFITLVLCNFRSMDTECTLINIMSL